MPTARFYGLIIFPRTPPEELAPTVRLGLSPSCWVPELLRHNPAIEINVVDPISRKGYRFKGTGPVLTEGPTFDEILAFYRGRGLVHEERHYQALAGAKA